MVERRYRKPQVAGSIPAPGSKFDILKQSMPSNRMSSRLAKHQQQQMLRQTLIYIILAIVLGIAFVFFILPRSINLFFTLTGGNQQALVGSPDLPPQVPAFSAPPLATSSASIMMTGFGTPKSEIVMVVNGSQRNSETVEDDGSFEIKVDLDEGENQVSAFAKNTNDQESAVSRTYTVIRDSQAPSLEISTPTDGQSFELSRNQLIPVNGTTEAGGQIQLNGRSIYTSPDGTFSTTYQLQEGENTLDFTARDRAGNQSQKTIKVTFRF